jgi:hypothetical protein
VNVKEAREAIRKAAGEIEFSATYDFLDEAMDALVAAAKEEAHADLWIVNSSRPLVNVTNLGARARVACINRNAPCDVQDGPYVNLNVAGAQLENATCGETATLIISVPVNAKPGTAK